MLKYDEIKKIITEEYGFDSVEKYRAFLSDPDIKKRIDFCTPERIARLSPDVVDCIDFWKVTDDVFGEDTVCNTCWKGEGHNKDWNYEQKVSRERANFSNLMIAKLLGMLDFIDEMAHRDVKVVEFGAGFGSFKNYVERNTRNVYLGFDVVPRVEGIKPVQADGTLFESDIVALEGTVQNVMCTNVFQHLSQRQRESYIRAAYRMLVPGGLFIFNSMLDFENPSPYRINDNLYAIHYGQYTPLMKVYQTHNYLARTGWKVLYFNQRHDCVCSYVCQKL